MNRTREQNARRKMDKISSREWSVDTLTQLLVDRIEHRYSLGMRVSRQGTGSRQGKTDVIYRHHQSPVVGDAAGAVCPTVVEAEVEVMKRALLKK